MVPKFRAWLIQRKRMIELRGFKKFPATGNIRIYTDTTSPVIDKDDIILMQSTELTDKNGIEVFEGDVVILHRFVLRYSLQGAYEDEEELIGVIVHERLSEGAVGKVYPRQWGLKVNGDVLFFSLLEGLHEESFQVVGSIYENTELLEGGNDKV